MPESKSLMASASVSNNYVLLLGAGFSRNWNGWLADEVFDFLLTCPEIASDSELQKILWAHSDGGFESALEQVQNDFADSPQSEVKRARLNAMQNAVTRMFREMNAAFYQDPRFESHNNRDRTVRQFLARFDAIFTLNQDLLVEHHYKDQFDVSLESPRRWDSIQIPGMKRLPVDEPMFDKSWARAQWQPLTDAEYKIAARSQPYFKLHGSCNWVTTTGTPLLIMGGGKEEAIRQHPILSRYALEFENRLCCPSTRLMAIGYGFRDHHINRAIARGVYDHGLKMFVVSPKGRDLAKVLSSSTLPGAAMAIYKYDLEDIFRVSLIGVSQRPLRDTFGRDAAEFNKVQRFFDA